MFSIKRGDSKIPLKAQLSRSESGPVDLTDCAVRFIMADAAYRVVIDAPAEILDAASGIVWYVFSVEETSVAGAYKAEFEVTFPDGRKETFPDNGFIPLTINIDLG